MQNRADYNAIEPDHAFSKDPTGDRRKSGPSIQQYVLASLVRGDHQAFENVYRKFYPRTREFIRVLTRSGDTADELTQKVFVNLWLNREKIDPERNFNAYLYRMARNETMNYFRSVNSHLSVFEDTDVDAAGESSEGALIAGETYLLVKLTVERMPGQRKLVFDMSRYQQKSNDEIASELGITKKAVEKHLRLALRDLNQVLKIFLMMV